MLCTTSADLLSMHQLKIPVALAAAVLLGAASIFDAVVQGWRVDVLAVLALACGFALFFVRVVRSRESVRRSEEQYRLLFDSNPTPMWVYDLETLRFLAVNTAAVQTDGYSGAQFLSMTIAHIMPRAD